jgi:hypothetical protein
VATAAVVDAVRSGDLLVLFRAVDAILADPEVDRRIRARLAAEDAAERAAATVRLGTLRARLADLAAARDDVQDEIAETVDRSELVDLRREFNELSSEIVLVSRSIGEIAASL